MKTLETLQELIATLGWQQKLSRLPESEIAQTEARLGFTLPALLRSFYRELSAHPLFKNQGGYALDLVPLAELKIDEEEQLVILTEGLGMSSVWESIPRAELALPNPKSQFWVVDSMHEEHELFEGLRNAIMTNALASYRQRVSLRGVASEQLQGILPALQALPPEEGVEFYVNAEVFITYLREKNRLTVESRTVAALRQILEGLKATQSQALQLHISDLNEVDIADIAWLRGTLVEAEAMKLFVENRAVSFEALPQLAEQAAAKKDIFEN